MREDLFCCFHLFVLFGVLPVFWRLVCVFQVTFLEGCSTDVRGCKIMMAMLRIIENSAMFNPVVGFESRPNYTGTCFSLYSC